MKPRNGSRTIIQGGIWLWICLFGYGLNFLGKVFLSKSSQVHFGVKSLCPEGTPENLCPAHHWALKVGRWTFRRFNNELLYNSKVGDWWYEIRGADKNDNGEPNEVIHSAGRCSKGGACPGGASAQGWLAWLWDSTMSTSKRSLLGTTKKSDVEICDFSRRWEKEHPDYHLLKDNCQSFVHALYTFLMENGTPCTENALPWMESPVACKK